MLILQETQI